MCRLWLTTGCNFNDYEVSILKKDLLNCLSSGGPDYQKFLRFKNSYCFHARLAIQDLTNDSNQPLVTRNSAILVFNGEIFNWPELYDELDIDIERPQSDTQFLAILLENNLIEKFIDKFKGFFSFVFYDPNTHSILFARDCFGVKPLYFSIINNKYPAFSSTSEALAKHPFSELELDQKGIEIFMRYGFFSHNSSPFKNINQVNPGKLYKCKLNHNDQFDKFIVIKNYGIETLPFNNANQNLNQEFDENYFDHLLKRSCKLRMLSDVPNSLLLSGGIDSSLLALVYSKKLGIDLPCFTLKFTNSAEGDETEVASKTAKILGLHHTILGFDSNSISESISKVFYALDQPFVDTSILPTYILCDLISKSYKVAISADGGDEAFAGYPKYVRNKSINSKLKKLQFLPKNIFNRFAGLNFKNQLLEKIFLSLSSDQELFKAIYFYQHQIWSSTALSKLMYRNADGISHSIYEDLIKNQSLSELAQLQTFDLSFYMRDDILYKIDRASMANGLELREPFLDQDLVNYGLSLTDKSKLYKKSGKNCLRNFIGKELPHLSKLKKKGFGIPEDILQNSEFMKDMSSDIFKKNSKIWDILDKKIVKKFLSDKNLTSNQRWQLKSLIVWSNIKNI